MKSIINGIVGNSIEHLNISINYVLCFKLYVDEKDVNFDVV